MAGKCKITGILRGESEEGSKKRRGGDGGLSREGETRREGSGRKLLRSNINPFFSFSFSFYLLQDPRECQDCNCSSCKADPQFSEVVDVRNKLGDRSKSQKESP